MLPARRLQELGQQVEAGGLAGAVRADQRVDGAAPDGQVHVAHGDEALELLGQTARLEDDVVSHALRTWDAGSRAPQRGYPRTARIMVGR